MKGLATFVVAAMLASKAAATCLCPLCVLPAYRMVQAVSVSMLPAVDTGDCMIVQRLQPEDALPPRGAIILFEHPTRGDEYLFRLIGYPGDRVQISEGRLQLNGLQVAQSPMPDLIRNFDTTENFRCPAPIRDGQSCTIPQWRETLPGGVSYPVLNLENGVLDNTAVLTVPAGHVFVLGDNRDNAADSRMIRAAGGPGMIPIENIWGVEAE